MYSNYVPRAQAEGIKRGLVDRFKLHPEKTGYSGRYRRNQYSVKINIKDPREDLNVHMNIEINSNINLPIEKELKKMEFK